MSPRAPTRGPTSMTAFIYILTNKRYGILYVGVTNDLIRRMHEHKQKMQKSFSSKYETTQLVYFESGESIEGAIMREKQLKNWKRSWKIELIEKTNPNWEDLSLKLL